MARRVRLILQTFKFTIYSIIVHYKHRVPPQFVRIGGDKKNFSLASLANSLFCTPHYGTRGAAPERSGPNSSVYVYIRRVSQLGQGDTVCIIGAVNGTQQNSIHTCI